MYGGPQRIVFCASCVFMLYSSVSYAAAHKPVALIALSAVLAIGLVVHRMTDSRRRAGS